MDSDKETSFQTKINLDNESSIQTMNKLEIENNPNSKEFYSNYRLLIDKIGYNKYTWITFSISNILQTVIGTETMLLSIYFENLSKVFLSNDNKLISLGISLIISCQGLGSIMVGYLSNKFGRVKTLRILILIFLIANGLCSIINNFYLIFMLRCIANFSIGVFSILPVNLLFEYLPSKNRNYNLMLNSGFFNLGSLYTIIIKFIFPDPTEKTLYLSNFKIVNILSCIPGFIAFLLIYLKANDSPSYLLQKSHNNIAIEILEKMARCNNIIIENIEKENIIKEVKEIEKCHNKSSYSELFKKDFMMITILCIIIFLVFSFNFFGICYLAPLTFKYIPESKFFSENTNLLIYGLVQIPNGLIGGLMTESKCLKIKMTMFVCSLLCGLFYFLSFFDINLLCFCSGMIFFFSSISLGCSFIYVIEVYPTYLVDHAQSLIQFFTYLSYWSPYLIDYSIKFSLKNNYAYFGISCLVSGILVILLPLDRNKKALQKQISIE